VYVHTHTHTHCNIYHTHAHTHSVCVSQVVVPGAVGGLNIGVLNGVRQREFRDQVMALCGSSLHSKHSKLSDITAGKLSVKFQFIVHNSNKAMTSEWNLLMAFKELGKKIVETGHPPRKYRVQNESVLDQQSISGKIVCLILCMWKPGYVKSVHILLL